MQINQSSQSNIMNFNFEGNEVRTVTDEHGEIWFVANDVCAALEFGNPRQAIASHVDEGDVQSMDTHTPGGKQAINHVNESGLYALIFGSRKEAAKRFKKWVTSEVLPSIRKTGSYHVQAKPKTVAEMFLESAHVMVELQRRTETVELKLLEQEQKSIEYEKKLEQVHNSQVLNKCPSNAESITHIRSRMNEKYGLSAAVVDAVMRQLPYAPKPAAIVRNENDKAFGSTYNVYWTKDVSAVFKRFVDECEPSNTRYTHPFIFDQKFRLNKES